MYILNRMTKASLDEYNEILQRLKLLVAGPINRGCQAKDY